VYLSALPLCLLLSCFNNVVESDLVFFYRSYINLSSKFTSVDDFCETIVPYSENNN
jgi:hypothetical protein